MLLRGGDLSTVFAVFAFDGAHSDSAAGPSCSGYAVGAAGAAFVYGSSTRTMLDTASAEPVRPPSVPRTSSIVRRAIAPQRSAWHYSS